jgi:hypothetical protein
MNKEEQTQLFLSVKYNYEKICKEEERKGKKKKHALYKQVSCLHLFFIYDTKILLDFL